ncbi:MAG: hypothetical protein IPH09_16035 [bacterium]|nr:hypothetical protein [bacterium]
MVDLQGGLDPQVRQDAPRDQRLPRLFQGDLSGQPRPGDPVRHLAAEGIAGIPGVEPLLRAQVHVVREEVGRTVADRGAPHARVAQGQMVGHVAAAAAPQHDDVAGIRLRDVQQHGRQQRHRVVAVAVEGRRLAAADADAQRLAAVERFGAECGRDDQEAVREGRGGEVRVEVHQEIEGQPVEAAVQQHQDGEAPLLRPQPGVAQAAVVRETFDLVADGLHREARDVVDARAHDLPVRGRGQAPGPVLRHRRDLRRGGGREQGGQVRLRRDGGGDGGQHRTGDRAQGAPQRSPGHRFSSGKISHKQGPIAADVKSGRPSPGLPAGRRAGRFAP